MYEELDLPRSASAADLLVEDSILSILRQQEKLQRKGGGRVGCDVDRELSKF